MRQSFTGSTLDSTTLASIGLSSGSARFTISFPEGQPGGMEGAALSAGTAPAPAPNQTGSMAMDVDVPAGAGAGAEPMEVEKGQEVKGGDGMDLEGDGKEASEGTGSGSGAGNEKDSAAARKAAIESEIAELQKVKAAAVETEDFTRAAEVGICLPQPSSRAHTLAQALIQTNLSKLIYPN